MNNTKSPLFDLKQNIINYAVWIGAVLGTLAVLASLLRIGQLGITLGFILDVSCLFLVYGAAIWYRHIPDSYKALIISFTVFQSFFLKTYYFGVLNPNIIYFIIGSFFLTVYIKKKFTFIILTLAVIGYLILMVAFLSGNVTPMTDSNELQLAPVSWIVTLIILLMATIIMSYFIYKFTDVSEEMVDKLQKSQGVAEEKQANLKSLFDSTHHLIGIFDKNLLITDFNESFAKYIKLYSNIDLKKNNNLLDKINFVEAELLRQNLTKALTGKKFREIMEYPSNKKTLYLLISYTPIYLNLEISGVAMFVEDITEHQSSKKQLEKYSLKLEQLVNERTSALESTNEELTATNEELFMQREELEKALFSLKSTQEKLVQSEKMASLGVLAAGVAHEINNPLNFIKGGTEGLQVFLSEQQLNDDEDAKALIAAINEGVNRAHAIVKSLNHFSRENSKTMEKVILKDVIDNCLTMIRNQVKHKVTVNCSYSDPTISIEGNEGRLHQAILNLLSNAEQSIADSGNIDIHISNNEDFVVITITDNGMGINPDILHKIKDPFFTTKEPGKGTGLGLSITQKIIEEHKGTLTIESLLGKGTSATIELPVKAGSISVS